MNIPNHLGIICDGNRRFAKSLGEVAWKGHEYGAEKIEECLDWCIELGVSNITLWLFSTENFNRSKEELEQIFEIAKKFVRKFAENPKVHKNEVKLSIIGDLSIFPRDVQDEINNALEKTKNYNKFNLNIAAGYGGKQEILKGVRNVAKLVEEGKLKANEITSEILEANIYSSSVPNIDLVIRTSGEQRTSGFMLWKTDYAEFYFSDKFWPEFDKEEFTRALLSYSERQRRFGK